MTVALDPFDDIEADVFEWLPVVQVHVPGCGISPWNVWELSFDWWRRYREIAVSAVEQLNKLKGGRRG